MINVAPEFAERLHIRVRERLAQKKDEVARGLAEDLPDYRGRVGYILALTHVLDDFDDIIKSMNEGK